MLNDNTINSVIPCEEEEDELIEEYLDEEDATDHETPQIIEVISLPSVRNLEDKKDKNAILRLIDEIEAKNEMILEFSKPQLKTKRKKVPKTSMQLKPEGLKVERNEGLKFEKESPKIVIRPDGTNSTTILVSRDKNCSVCSQNFSSDFLLKRHQTFAHPLQVPLVCCNEVFELMQDYKKHQASKHPKTIECQFCGKILKSRKTFLVHKRSHQTVEERKFKCLVEGCSKAFNFKLHLENHERAHSGIKPFNCNLCSSSFKQSYQLTLHKRKHAGIVNQCKICNLKFPLKSQLAKHENSCNRLERKREKRKKSSES
jgi:hypothetical protein